MSPLIRGHHLRRPALKRCLATVRLRPRHRSLGDSSTIETALHLCWFPQKATQSIIHLLPEGPRHPAFALALPGDGLDISSPNSCMRIALEEHPPFPVPPLAFLRISIFPSISTPAPLVGTRLVHYSLLAFPAALRVRSSNAILMLAVFLLTLAILSGVRGRGPLTDNSRFDSLRFLLSS